MASAVSSRSRTASRSSRGWSERTRATLSTTPRRPRLDRFAHGPGGTCADARSWARRASSATRRRGTTPAARPGRLDPDPGGGVLVGGIQQAGVLRGRGLDPGLLVGRRTTGVQGRPRRLLRLGCRPGGSGGGGQRAAGGGHDLGRPGRQGPVVGLRAEVADVPVVRERGAGRLREPAHQVGDVLVDAVGGAAQLDPAVAQPAFDVLEPSRCGTAAGAAGGAPRTGSAGRPGSVPAAASRPG